MKYRERFVAKKLGNLYVGEKIMNFLFIWKYLISKDSRKMGKLGDALHKLLYFSCICFVMQDKIFSTA